MQKQIEMEKIGNNLKKISKFLLLMAAYQVFNLMMYFNNFSSVDTSALDDMSQMMMPALRMMGVIPFVVSILVYVFLLAGILLALLLNYGLLDFCIHQSVITTPSYPHSSRRTDCAKS